MEESEKRRERLRAMRNEASVAEGSSNFQSPVGAGALANPLVDTPIEQDSHASTRFDYYTDPMAAYSGIKRQNNFNQSSRDCPAPFGGSGSAGRGNPMVQLPPPPSLGPRNPQMTTQPNYSLDQGMQQGWRPPYYGPGSVRPPMPLFNPHPEHQNHSFPNQPFNPRLEHQHHGFPNQPFIPSGHYPPMPRPGNWAGPTNPGRGGTHYPSPGRGRSRGQWTNNSSSTSGSGSGYGRRGRGFGNRSNDTPQNLYRKSMVEDPWKDLKPVVWRAAVSSELFRKLSSDAKKAKVEEACIVPRVKKESLADYLADAFDEATEGGGAL